MYAKWDAVTVPKATIKKLKNLSRLKVKVTMKKCSGVVGYEVMCSSKKNMKKNVKRNTFNASSGTLTVAKKGTIYVKARVYKLDSAGYKVYGKWSSIKKVKVKK